MLEDAVAPPSFRAAVAFFNTGDYVLAYEMVEQVWQTAPDEARDFYKGFVQTAAAFAKLRQGSYGGAESLLSTGLALLEGYEPVAFGLDLTGFLDAAGAVLERLRRLGPERVAEAAAGPMPRLTRATNG